MGKLYQAVAIYNISMYIIYMYFIEQQRKNIDRAPYSEYLSGSPEEVFSNRKLRVEGIYTLGGVVDWG